MRNAPVIFVALLLRLTLVVGAARADDGPLSAEKLFSYFENDKWGYCNRKGEVVIEPRFQWAGDFRSGLAYVNTPDTGFYIDEKGNSVFRRPEDPDRIWKFHDGMARFEVTRKIGAEGQRKFGYFDGAGKAVVEARFDDGSEFSQGLAAVNVGAQWTTGRGAYPLGGKWGYIDKTGKLVI